MEEYLIEEGSREFLEAKFKKLQQTFHVNVIHFTKIDTINTTTIYAAMIIRTPKNG